MPTGPGRTLRPAASPAKSAESKAAESLLSIGSEANNVNVTAADESELADGATSPKIVVIGAGPAGLTAAYVLAKRGVTTTVLESDTVVGGISRTAERDGWRFDIGGAPVFSKGETAGGVWVGVLRPPDLLRRPR